MLPDGCGGGLTGGGGGGGVGASHLGGHRIKFIPATKDGQRSFQSVPSEYNLSIY